MTRQTDETSPSDPRKGPIGTEADDERHAPVHGADILVLEAVTDDGGHAPGILQRLARSVDLGRIGALLMAVLFALVGLAVYSELETLTWANVKAASGDISWSDVAWALFGTALSYTALIGYDWLALRQVSDRKIPLGTTALTSFIAHAFTFSLGFGVLTGGAVRLRLYQSTGLEADRIVAAGVLCSLTLWAGLATTAGIALVIDPFVVEQATGWSQTAARLTGVVILAGFSFWLYLTSQRTRVIEVKGWTVQLPGLKTTLLSVLVGVVDTTAAALALWFLLPDSADITFPAFIVMFIIATVIGIVSHVPGGLGVFDGVLLLGMKAVPEAAMVASLLAFRAIYYVMPLVLSAVLLAAWELSGHSAAVKRGARAVASAAQPLLPPVVATSTFLGGLVLLISGALPAEAERLAVLKRLVPLPFVETSHFIASIIGSLLLVVAHGLVNRMQSAWRAAVALLGTGALFSVIKGFDYEEAVICLSVVALLIAGRKSFYRQGGILAGRTSSLELLAIAVAAIASLWIGFTVYRTIDYSNSLWWDFAYHGDAPRFLRASLGMAVVLMIVAVYQMLHRTESMQSPAEAEDLSKALDIVAKSGKVEANLANIGDKRFLFSSDGTGFVMYGVQGRSWVAMGDPIAPTPDQASELIWRFKEVVDEHRGIPVFYQVSPSLLPAYLDAGFSLIKLGEEAWVDLEAFTLQGGEGRKLRQTFAKAERSGGKLSIVPKAEVPAILDELRAVSEQWLASRGGKEKGFSLGFWADDYVLDHDIAVVRHDGRIVAFSNIWKTGDRNEFSVDLMRHTEDAPQGIMDLLFIGLFQHAKAEGYRWFNLGMAPLSGLPQHRLSSLWSRFGTFFFRHADRLYNFEGLRQFKNKFKPEWRPKYLAYPGGLMLPQVLIDIVALVSASPKRSVRRTHS